MLKEKPETVIAIHPASGITKGTLDMVNKAMKQNIKIIYIKY